MEIKIMITINRGKRDKIRERAKEYGINPSVVTVYGILRLLDKLNGKRLTNVDRKFVALAVAEYKPYENETDICNTTVSYIDSAISRPELAKQLLNHGFRLVSLCKAFYGVLLKCDVNSIPTRSTQDGFILTPISAKRVFNLKNRPLDFTIRISEPVFQKLNEIATRNETSAYRIIARAVDTIISIEYEKDTFIENGDIIRENILTYNRKVANVTGRCGISFNMRKISRGVRVLLLLEKYGIPGISEFFHRIIRFILLSHSGEILLSRIHVNDDSDYNETRIIRNDLRKEVLYAATR